MVKKIEEKKNKKKILQEENKQKILRELELIKQRELEEQKKKLLIES
jgi:hypothetical protein